MSYHVENLRPLAHLPGTIHTVGLTLGPLLIILVHVETRILAHYLLILLLLLLLLGLLLLLLTHNLERISCDMGFYLSSPLQK